MCVCVQNTAKEIDRDLQSEKYNKYLWRSQQALKSGNFMVKEGPKELKG